MTFLPIVDRELRVRCPDKNTWRIRAFAAATASVVWAPLLLTGQQFFYVLSGLAVLFCVFEGARQTSDSISGERREGTLGLLFLTDLRGYDIVLGKLAVNSINSFFGLLAVFPILSLGLLVGGITAGEFWHMSLALVTTLLFSLAVGTCVSAQNTDERRAILVTTIVLVAVIGALPLLDNLFGFTARNQPVFSLFSPVSGCFMATDWAYRTGPHRFWLTQLAGLLSTAGLLAFAAVTLTPNTTINNETRTNASRSHHRARYRRSHVDVDPIPWLATANTAIPRVINLRGRLVFPDFPANGPRARQACCVGAAAAVRRRYDHGPVGFDERKLVNFRITDRNPCSDVALGHFLHCLGGQTFECRIQGSRCSPNHR